MDENGNKIEVLMQVSYDGEVWVVEEISGEELHLYQADDDVRITCMDFDVVIVD